MFAGRLRSYFRFCSHVSPLCGKSMRRIFHIGTVAIVGPTFTLKFSVTFVCFTRCVANPVATVTSDRSIFLKGREEVYNYTKEVLKFIRKQ